MSLALKNGTTYSQSGDAFSRGNLLLESVKESKILGLFDTSTGLRSYARVLSYVFGTPAREIVTVSDYLRFLRNKTGVYLGLTGIFDDTFRLERARHLYEYTLSR